MATAITKPIRVPARVKLVAAPGRAAVLAARPGRTAVLVAVGAGLLTLVLRLAMHTRSFDLFGDEVIYADMGRDVLSGGFPRYTGQVFFLNGPAFFYLEAAWAHLLGTPATLMGRVFQARALNSLFAAVTAAALVLLATRAASLRAGAAAGLLFALEPFCTRQNDRALLETSMMLWVVLGYLLYTRLMSHPPAPGGGRLRAVGAGLLFGCAALTKDEGTLLTVVPLLAAIGLRWGARRGLTLITVGTTVAIYAGYVGLAAVCGYFTAFWQAKTTGLQRMLGLIQVSGFHSAGGGSLSARLLAEAGYFGTTYVLLIAAVAAGFVVFRRGGQVPRLLGLVYVSAVLALGYALVLGTLEEQELYLLVVPSVLITPVAATLLPGVRTKAVAALAVILAINFATTVDWLVHPDNGLARALAYVTAHVPRGASITDAAVGPAGDIGQNALADYGYHAGLWVTPAARARQHVRYVLVPWAEVDEGYSYLSPAQVRRLTGQGQLVFSFRGRTFGDLALYRLRPAAGT
ncbi:MAG TPA: phospholipid carrier-dependent glycosyltransferase [Streptosporangiaceae bacterium]|nr:phospholipid carrier-dependent glycosyltransferase [Streptosporangiaceae bacterium]